MEQYHPDVHVGKKKGGSSRQVDSTDEVRYSDINRPASDEEVGVITKAARDAGL